MRIKNIFIKGSNKLWDKFKRNKHGVKITYIYLTVLQYEETDGDFNKWFKSSAREISYRSGMCISQVKDHLNSLILIKLVERKTKRTKKKEDIIDYESESFYRVKLLDDENFINALESFDYINIEKEVKQYGQKVRSKL